jgi:amino acid adenylation domain-containing protein/non-ribosomal peptide synthase protein (TIGR01720 family)
MAHATSLHRLVEARAAETPDRTAIVFEDQRLAYAQLEARATALYRRLRMRGTGPGDLVAVALERSPDLVAGMLAVLKTGAAYLPIETTYPAERVALMLADAGPVRSLTTSAVAARLPLPEPLFVDSAPDPAAEPPVAAGRPVLPDETAYIVYTSGSTGRPKGVVITHRAVVNYLTWMHAEYPFGPDDRMVQKTPAGFDGAVLEIFLPLIAGGTLVIAGPGVHREPELIADLIDRERITVAQFVPSQLPAFLDEDLVARCKSLRRVYSASDALPPAVQRRFQQRLGAELINLYGPTEATVDTAHWRCVTDSGGAQVPVGTPVRGMRIAVFDSRLRPAAALEIGEVCVSGVQLARGYLNRPGLTAERFVADPSGPAGVRMYRTGDLGRLRPDGLLEIIGRVDDQVKIRGVRVEPAEVEAALAEHPAVRQAAAKAVTAPSGETRLVGYVVAADGEHVSAEAVREYLRGKLPEPMVPSRIVFLDALPTTPNEKIDRAALPVPAAPSAVLAGSTLLSIVGEVLGQPRVSPEDSFIALGGDSIAAIQLASQARRAGFRISTGDVLRHRTRGQLARAAGQATEPTGAPVDGVGPFPPTPIMRWLRELGGPVDTFSQSAVLRTPSGMVESELLACLQAIVDRHDMLRARFPAGADGWAPEIRPAGAVSAADGLEVVDATGRAGTELHSLVRDRIEQALGRLRIGTAELLRTVWIRRGPAVQGRLVVLVHHLAVDGVSLRILQSDLDEAWRTLRQTGTPRLEPVPTPFRQWATLLDRESASDRCLRELDHWRSTGAGAAGSRTTRPLDSRTDTLATSRSRRFDLPSALTEPLLNAAPVAFHTDVNTILLTGLAMALSAWRGPGDRLIALEGHGREELFPGVDTSRTVGWFTSMFPVSLPAVGGPGTDVRQAVERVGARIAAIPGNGLGYGLLRHLNPRTAPELAGGADPELLFNYLGRFPEADRRDWSFDADHDVAMDESDGSMPLAYAVEVNALTMPRGGEQVFSAVWQWAGALLDEDEVCRLAELWFDALARIAGQAGAAGPGVDDLESEFRAF